jgi:chaperonin GroES
MAMNVRPLGDKIIVKRAEAQTKTESGIYLPESAKDKPKEGKVVALGSGILNKETGKYLPFTVKKGDRIIFSSYGGTEIKIDGEDLLIMAEDDILGVIEKD